MVITILSVLLAVSLFTIWNLLRKVEKLEDNVGDLSQYLYEVMRLVQMSNEKLEELDEKGAFQSDDEVGFFFENLKNIQGVLNAIGTNGRNNTEEERA